MHAYGIARTTNDIDFISLTPDPVRPLLCELAGIDSPLHKKHRVYLDPVTIATAPDAYRTRLRPLFAGFWKHVRLYALDPHDLALAKLERNFERDRDDVQRLVKAGLVSRERVLSLYHEEMRPYWSRETWHDQTIQLWIESFWPEEYLASDTNTDV